MKTATATAALLLTGNELLDASLLETNSLFLTEELNKLAIQVKIKVILPDNLDQIIFYINLLAKQVDLIILNGGMGLTADDYTNRAVAEVTKQKLRIHQMALAHLEKKLDRKVPEEDIFYKQAALPLNVVPFPNPVGLALGFRTHINEAILYALPGVPAEMKAIFRETLIQDIQKQIPSSVALPVFHLHSLGMGESKLQDIIYHAIPETTWQKEKIELGFRASIPITEIKITPTEEQAVTFAKQRHQEIKELLADYVFSETKSLPQTVLDLLKERKETISFAESCTGGRLVDSLIRLDGASSVVNAGLVTYTYEAKQRVLQVPEATLTQCGAVSKETILAMLQGAYKAVKSDYIIATSGLAGPGQGVEQAPVGTVWIGIAKQDKPIVVLSYLIKRDRVVFQNLVTNIALDVIRRYILDLPLAPNQYFFASLQEEYLFT